MALDLIAARLSRLELFRGLSSDQLRHVARDAERMVFRDGQKIIASGEQGDGAVIVISGRAMLMPDSELGIEAADVETGSMLGEAAMLADHTFRLTVCAVGDVRAVKLTRQTMHACMLDDPDLAQHLHARLANRLQRMAVELRLIDERLAIAGQLELMETPAA